MKITEQFLEELKDWFKDYTDSFLEDIDKININLKIEHTLRVCKDIISIGKLKNLNEDQMLIAETTALLHDVARFEQYKQFKTFRDADSFDHAIMGAEIIKKRGILNDLDEDIQELVINSVLYHNRLRLPEIKDPRLLLHAKLLRDADKLDIFKVVTDYYQLPETERNTTLELGLDNSDNVTDEILEAVLNGEDVDYNHAKFLNDFKLLQAGWVFTINYTPTLTLLKQRGYLVILKNALPKDDRIDLIFEKMDKYIAEKEDEHKREKAGS